MNPEDLPSLTLTELENSDEHDEARTREEIREDLQDWYRAREELDTMIVLTERFLEDLETIDDVYAELQELEEAGEQQGLALDRI